MPRSPWPSLGLAGAPGARGPTAAGIGGCFCPAPHPPPPPGRGAHLPPAAHVHCSSRAAGRKREAAGEAREGAQHLPRGAGARAGRSRRAWNPRLPVLSSDSGCGEPGSRADGDTRLPIAKPPVTTSYSPPPLPRPAGEGLSRVATQLGDTRGGAEGAENRPFVMSPGRRPGSLCRWRAQGVPDTKGKERVPLGVSWRNCVFLLAWEYSKHPLLNFSFFCKMIPSKIYVKQRLFSFSNTSINNNQYTLSIMALACMFIARKAETGKFGVGGKEFLSHECIHTCTHE